VRIGQEANRLADTEDLVDGDAGGRLSRRLWCSEASWKRFARRR
jgi:hypothetical protein